MRQIRWGIGKLVVRRPTEIPVEDCKDRTTRSLCRLKHKVRIAYTRDELDNTILQQLSEKMSPEQFRVNDLAKMKSALAWLTTLQLNSENFDLNKRKFYDTSSLRYCWTLKYLPSKSPCGKRFDVDHAMSYMKGGFVHRRHDDVRDLFASLLMGVCHGFEVGPWQEMF